MSFTSLVKVELTKWYHKRISLLLLLLFIPTILFGTGMLLKLSFFVSDGEGGGINALGSSLSGFGFAINMIGQGEYLLFLVVIILAAVTLSGEMENGQIKSELIRVCGRGKTIAAKYAALLILIYGTMLLSFLWSIIFYEVFLNHTEFSSGLLFDGMAKTQILYIAFMLSGVAVAVSVTFLLGIHMKLFSCFAVSYILWFASLYTDFMGKIRFLIPYNMPDYILENGAGLNTVALGNEGGGLNMAMYAGVYIMYCIVFIGVACMMFKKSDIKA